MIRMTADFSKQVRTMGKANGTNNGPLHTHTDESTAHRVECVNKLLAEYGLSDLECINTEWSCVRLHRDANGNWDRSQRDTMKSAIGALAAMIVFQISVHLNQPIIMRIQGLRSLAV